MSDRVRNSHDHLVFQSIDIKRRKLMLITPKAQRVIFLFRLSACASWFHSRFVHFDVISMILNRSIIAFVRLFVKTGSHQRRIGHSRNPRIENQRNWSRNGSHKFNGITVERIRTIAFYSSISQSPCSFPKKPEMYVQVQWRIQARDPGSPYF